MIIKKEREVSGMYFRFQNPVNGQFENRSFEDLPEDSQDEILKYKGIETLRYMVKFFANKLYEVCDRFDISEADMQGNGDLYSVIKRKEQ